MERKAKKVLHDKVPTIPPQKNIVFFHPDLGIGGAERLVIDVAVGLQELGHKVVIFTSHRDVKHCFDEARDGTLDVRVRGNFIFPATAAGRFKILCSCLRQIHLLIHITRSGELATLKPTVFFVDQLSAGIPFLRWFWEDVHTLFYCHFPDLLLVQNREAWHKRLWRLPFDWLEGWGIRGADRVVVNSGFTKGVAEGIWPGLGGERGVGVVYPCVDEPVRKDEQVQELWKGKKVLLSLNRFERKKNVSLAIRAFAAFKPEERKGVRLVIAGGYDVRVQENAEYHKELESAATSSQLKHATAKNIVSAQAVPDDIEVLFLLSVSDPLRQSLLENAKLLIYTPANEHFGIVPLEAMRASVPVIAANSGGPLETVVDGETGWLRPPGKPEEWTAVMKKVLFQLPSTTLDKMSSKARARVKEDFSKSSMARRIDEELNVAIKGPRLPTTELPDLGVAIIIYIIAVGSIFAIIREGVRPQIRGTENLASDYQIGIGIIAVAVVGMGLVTWQLMQNESAFA